jgi:FkbM family methyltransferase
MDTLAQVALPGFSQSLWIRPDGPTDRIVIREIFEENVYRIAASDVENAVVVDIGANIGAFSVYAALLGASRVIAVEPEPDNHRVLLANAEAFPCIAPRQCAIWETEGEQHLFPSHGATRITPDGPVVVPTQTLEQLFVEEHIGACAVLKVDTEGAEYPIFRVTPSAILSRIACIVIEFHDTDAETFGNLISKLSQTHAVQTLGSYERGGYLYCRRY